VGSVLKTYGKPEDQELAKVCLLVDKFFDIMNVRNHHEAATTLKEFQKRFTSLDDPRFQVG